MSQFYIQSTGGIGPIPPNVPTMFTTDVNGANAPFGNVVPDANNVNVFGNPLLRNQQGIITAAITNGSSAIDTIFIRYITNNVITLNAATVIGLTVPIPDDTAFTVESVITAFDPNTGDNFGGRMLAIGVNLLGTVAITTVIENISSGSGSLANCHINFTGQLDRVAVQITGIVTEVDWKILIPVIAIF